MLQMGGLYGVTKLHDGATATGNGKVLPCLTPDGGAVVAIGVQIAGMTDGEITFEGTIDGTNWIGVLAEDMNSNVDKQIFASYDGLFRVLVYPVAAFRARISDYNSGTITVTAVTAT